MARLGGSDTYIKNYKEPPSLVPKWRLLLPFWLKVRGVLVQRVFGSPRPPTNLWPVAVGGTWWSTVPAPADGLGSHGYVRAPLSGEGPKCRAARVQSRHTPGVLCVASPRSRMGLLRRDALSYAKSA